MKLFIIWLTIAIPCCKLSFAQVPEPQRGLQPKTTYAISDIENINLLATLLVHAQYEGYWKQLGMQFEKEIGTLLEQHLLAGLIDSPWVRTDDTKSHDDERFFSALQELVAYAFEEATRVKVKK